MFREFLPDAENERKGSSLTVAPAVEEKPREEPEQVLEVKNLGQAGPVLDLTYQSQQFPNPHAESLSSQGGAMFTKDEMAMFKGVDSSMWNPPKATSISAEFNASNLTLVDALVDGFTDYVGQRWPGLGQSLMLRTTSNLWNSVRKHHSCRTASERELHCKSFRSIYFASSGFTKFEIQLLEQWLYTLMELIPPWMRRLIVQDMRSYLECDE